MELHVRQATAEMEDGTQVDDDPKSEAGKRPIRLPDALQTDVKLHLERYAQPGPAGRLFIGPEGAIPRRRNFNRIWHKALKDAGIRDHAIAAALNALIEEARGKISA